MILPSFENVFLTIGKYYTNNTKVMTAYFDKIQAKQSHLNVDASHAYSSVFRALATLYPVLGLFAYSTIVLTQIV